MQLTTDAIASRAADLAEVVTGHRRTIHRHPELAFEEHRTAAYVEQQLDRLGIEHRRVVGTGVVGVLRGDGERAVGVRADMDALPVPEARGRVGYRSVVPDVSHACGHDAHVAMALGVAELLADAEGLAGDVALYFQPAEEATGGAAPMVRAGVLDDPQPDAVLGVHVASWLPSGTIGLRHGPVTAANDTVRLVVRGRGGHGAHPDGGVDAINAAVHVLSAIQTTMTREVDPVEPVVISFGTIHGGRRENVIADEVVVTGTLRAVDPDVRVLLHRRISEVAHGVASALRATCEVEITPGFGVGVNDAHLADLLGEAAGAVLGGERVVWQPAPSLGSEDFFDFGRTGVPVAMFRLGTGSSEHGTDAPHHSADFDVDETALPAGVAVLCEGVRRVLAGHR